MYIPLAAIWQLPTFSLGAYSKYRKHQTMKQIIELIIALAVIIAEALRTPRTEEGKLKELGSGFLATLAEFTSEIAKLDDSSENELKLNPASTLERLFVEALAAKPPIEQNIADVQNVLSQVPRQPDPVSEEKPKVTLEFAGGDKKEEEEQEKEQNEDIVSKTE